MTETMILIDSDEAARFGTVEGWIGRDGFFYGVNEEAARYRGCTHLYCASCNAIIPRGGLSICNDCKEKRYDEMPKMRVDWKVPLYSQSNSKYFFKEKELHDFIGEQKCSIKPLRLVICEPNRFRMLDESFFADDLPDGAELPDALKAAIDALNAVIESLPPASWSPGKYAADL
jgi:hypothetical protein